MWRKYRILALVVFQLAIVAAMLVRAMLPLLTGQPLKLAVNLSDPRDLLRVDYLALTYDISQINLDSLPNDLPPEGEYHFGDALYLELETSAETAVAAGLWQRPPNGDRPFIKGIVAHTTYLSSSRVISLNYGIESYFLHHERPRKLEEHLRNRPDTLKAPPVVTVMVDARGTARIKEIDYLPGEK